MPVDLGPIPALIREKRVGKLGDIQGWRLIHIVKLTETPIFEKEDHSMNLERMVITSDQLQHFVPERL